MSENALTLTKDDARAIGMPTGTEWNAMLKMGMDLVGTGFLPSSIKTREQAAAIMLKGMELRVPPMQALSQIVMVQGKPTVSSELMLGLIYRDHGKQALRVKHTDNKSCTVEYRVEGWEGTSELTFTIEDAKQAGLLGKSGPWSQYPAVMLRWRAISQVAKIAFPETIGGMYVAGELGENVRVEGDNIISDPDAIESTGRPATTLTNPNPPSRTGTPASDKQISFIKGVAKELKDDTGALIFVRPDGHTNAASVDALVQVLTKGAESLDTLTSRGASYVIDWLKDAGEKKVDRNGNPVPGVNAGMRQQIHRVMQNHNLRSKWYPEDTAPLPFVNPETGEVAQEAAAGSFAEAIEDDDYPTQDEAEAWEEARHADGPAHSGPAAPQATESSVNESDIIDVEYDAPAEPKSGRGPDDNYVTDTKQLLRDFLASKSPQDGKYLMDSVPAPDQRRWLIKQITSQDDLDMLRLLFLTEVDFKEYNQDFTAQIKVIRDARNKQQ